MDEQSYRVVGMTCEHCVAAVTREVEAIPGTSDVRVVLDPGTVSFTGAGVDVDAVRAAVAEAGYSLA